jgi:GT2 family glycosyltransferase
VVLQDDYIGEALRGFQAGERIGMVSGRILRFDKNTLDSTGLFLTPFRTARERGYGQKESGRYLKAGYIFGVCGAVAFYRRKMLEAVKAGEEYFDNSFGYFYEDLDIAWRGQRQGWRGYYIPTAIAFHLRGASVREPHGCGKPFARLYLRREFKRNIRRNRYAMILKNESLWPRLLHLPLAAAYDLAVWLFIICSKPAAICAAVARSWRC